MSVVEFRHDRTQIIVAVAILHPDPSAARMARTGALLDTGASLCGLDRALVEELGLPRASKVTVQTPAGLHVAKTYRFRLGFYPDAASAMPVVMDREFTAIESHPGERFDTLIGMNVLGTGELTLSSNGTGSFAFR